MVGSVVFADAEPGPALGADSDSDTDSDDAEPGRGLSREDSIDRLVSRTASYFTAPWSRAMASWRVEYRRAGRRGQAGVQVRAQHERRVAPGARGAARAARARGVSASGAAAVGRADAAEPDVHAAEPRGKDAVRAAPPQPGRRARAAVDPAARGVVAGRDAADASPGATAVVLGGRARRGVPGARRAHRARGPPGRRARGRSGGLPRARGGAAAPRRAAAEALVLSTPN